MLTNTIIPQTIRESPDNHIEEKAYEDEFDKEKAPTFPSWMRSCPEYDRLVKERLIEAANNIQNLSLPDEEEAEKAHEDASHIVLPPWMKSPSFLDKLSKEGELPTKYRTRPMDRLDEKKKAKKKARKAHVNGLMKVSVQLMLSPSDHDKLSKEGASKAHEDEFDSDDGYDGDYKYYADGTTIAYMRGRKFKMGTDKLPRGYVWAAGHDGFYKVYLNKCFLCNGDHLMRHCDQDVDML